MIARENTTFMAEIGPAANPRGYTAITGKIRNIIMHGHNITWCTCLNNLWHTDA